MRRFADLRARGRRPGRFGLGLALVATVALAVRVAYLLAVCLGTLTAAFLIVGFLHFLR